MPSTTVMSRDEIYQHVKEVLEEALGVDEEDINPQAKVFADLGAESLDMLDISFRLEKKFSTPDKPFKIDQAEMVPQNIMENPQWISDGKLTDAGMTMLRERMPHVDLTEFDKHREITQVPDLITVQSLVQFVERKLA